VNLLEVVCVVIVGIWLAGRLVVEPDRAGRSTLILRMAAMATAAWIAEDSAIRLYGFYFYAADRWTVFVDQVPLLVLIIWPVVVTSGIDLLGALRVPASRWPLLLGLLVVADAWFIEPVAVDAGLWTWTSPGPFTVPTIGVLGWGFYAVGVGVVVASQRAVLWMLLVAPLLCHVLLLATWWGLLRWIDVPPPDAVVAGIGWLVAVTVVVAIARRRPPGLRRLVFFRAPAAVFFFGLLAVYGRDEDDAALVTWALAFAPPWLALLTLSPSMAPPSAPSTTTTTTAAT
jgi:hypothetical protein